MIHLYKNDDGEFFCNIVKKGREVWRTSETYKRRAGALNAVFGLAKLFNTEWNGEYSDHTEE